MAIAQKNNLKFMKNFKEKPFHKIYQDPIKNLSFSRIENKVVQISWNTAV